MRSEEPQGIPVSQPNVKNEDTDVQLKIEKKSITRNFLQYIDLEAIVMMAVLPE